MVQTSLKWSSLVHMHINITSHQSHHLSLRLRPRAPLDSSFLSLFRFVPFELFPSHVTSSPKGPPFSYLISKMPLCHIATRKRLQKSKRPGLARPHGCMVLIVDIPNTHTHSHTLPTLCYLCFIFCFFRTSYCLWSGHVVLSSKIYNMLPRFY